MKAIAIHAFGPAGNLTEIDIPVPIPGEHEILIEMYATSVNPADLKVREGSLPAGSGHTPAFPLIPGIDVAGVVVSTGSGVSRFKPGDAVFGLMQVKKGGAYAEYTLANGQELAPIPRGYPLKQLALCLLPDLPPGRRLPVPGSPAGTACWFTTAREVSAAWRSSLPSSGELP